MYCCLRTRTRITVEDASAFDNVAEMLLLLPALLTFEERHAATGRFLCNCNHYSGNPCSSMFSSKEFEAIQCCCLEMTRKELDIAILAQLSCGMHLSDRSSHGHKKEGSPRVKQRTDFYHHGHRICRETFKFMHNIGQDKLNALIKHYKQNGIAPQMHGNVKQLPPNALKTEDNAYVAHFLLNCAETHGMHLPG